MASIYDNVDLRFSWSGDFLLGEDGDLGTSEGDILTSFIDQIHDILASSSKDWEIYPNRGATINDFIGEPNSETTAKKLHDRVRISLTSAGVIREQDLKVRIIPVQINRILIILNVSVIATSLNGLTPGEDIKLAYVFDTIEQEVFFLNQSRI